MSKWKPIETAPRGKKILIYDPTETDDPVRLAWYSYEPDGDSVEKAWNDGYQVFYPTHWLPIPALPNVQAQR